MIRKSLAALGAAALLGGCAGDAATDTGTDTGSPTAPSPAATVDATIQATEFAFVMPDVLPAGEVTFEYENTGGQPHFFEIVEVEEGVTDEEVEEALQARGEPEWALGEAPGFGLLSSGTSAVATGELAAGSYLFVCFIPDSDGTPHAAKGMYQLVTAEEGPDPVAPPGPDVTVEVGKDGWTLPDLSELEPGEVTFEIVGSPDAKNHSFEVARIEDDAITTVAEGDKAVNAWFKSGYEDEAPVTFVGGLFEVRPGETRLLTLNLEAGRYGFVDDPGGTGEIVEIG